MTNNLRMQNDTPAAPEADEHSAMKQKALASLSPSVSAGLVTRAFYGSDSAEYGWGLIDEIQRVINNVRKGHLHDMEAMLVAQALALQAMFTNLSVSNAREPHRLHKASNLVLALKAQNQSRAAIAALVELKFPKQATFVKQANIASGAQQVNNGVSKKSLSRAKQKFAPQNKLLKADDGQIISMDPRTTAKAERSHSSLGALEKINGTKKPRR